MILLLRASHALTCSYDHAAFFCARPWVPLKDHASLCHMAPPTFVLSATCSSGSFEFDSMGAFLRSGEAQRLREFGADSISLVRTYHVAGQWVGHGRVNPHASSTLLSLLVPPAGVPPFEPL